MATTTTSLTGRHRALLRAVAAGRCELTGSAEPHLYVDGLSFTDQPSARALVHARLVAPAAVAGIGERVRALLTAHGRALLDAA